MSARDRTLKSTEIRRRQVAGMFRRQRGLCHWCKELMVLFDPAKIVRHRPMPKNLATIDHLDDRFSPNRGQRPGEIRRVLACKRCNELRGQLSQASQPIEKLRERAKRHALGEIDG